MLGLFRNDRQVVKQPRIMVCEIGSGENEELTLASERLIYESVGYNDITQTSCPTVQDLVAVIEHEAVDLIHVLARVTSDGCIGNQPGQYLLARLSKADVKVAIFASSNPSDGYLEMLSGRQAAMQNPMNIVMTLDRKGDKFLRFFRELFRLMAKGVPMPRAWVKLVPQAQGSWQDDVPDTIFMADRGQVRLIP